MHFGCQCTLFLGQKKGHFLVNSVQAGYTRCWLDGLKILKSESTIWVTHVCLSAIRVSSCMHMLHMYNQSSLVLKVQISPKRLRTGLLRLVKFPLSIYSQHAFYPRRNFRLEHNHWCFRHISRRFGWREFKYVYFARWLCYRQRLPQSGI